MDVEMVYKIYDSLVNELRIQMKTDNLIPDIAGEDEDSPLLQYNDVDRNHVLLFVKGVINFVFAEGYN